MKLIKLTATVAIIFSLGVAEVHIEQPTKQEVQYLNADINEYDERMDKIQEDRENSGKPPLYAMTDTAEMDSKTKRMCNIITKHYVFAIKMDRQFGGLGLPLYDTYEKNYKAYIKKMNTITELQKMYDYAKENCWNYSDKDFELMKQLIDKKKKEAKFYKNAL